jgi:hypothetical protein
LVAPDFWLAVIGLVRDTDKVDSAELLADVAHYVSLKQMEHEQKTEMRRRQKVQMFPE